MSATLSLQAVHDEWAQHPLGKRRAQGGRVALGGFLYQLYLSLDQFFGQVLQGKRDAQFVFEGLSDLAELRGDLVYLTQIKATLDLRSLRSAVGEALAVDQFLAERHPELRERVRYQLAVRRVRSATATDIGALSAEQLQLDDDGSRLWMAIRDRFMPVEIRANPKIDLAIRLWPHARQCFTLVDSCLGRLFTLLGENRSSAEIAEALLDVWDRARAEERPPCHLLGPQDLAPVQNGSKRIVHGVRPGPEDLRQGCFMERPELVKAVLRTIRKMSLQLETSQGRQRLPIYWIVGPSGAGKSALVLQVMRELLLQGQVEVSNYLAELAHTLPRALTYWSGASEQVLIVVDDLFAPENRDPQLWRQVAECAFATNWRRVPWILTCGPLEQLRAFKNEAFRHPELLPVEIPIEPMNSQEMTAYHAWYQQRTSTHVPILKEPILVAAAWMYELRRQTDLSPEDFAARFYARLTDLGLESPARAAMALNQYGLTAPEGLFAGLESSLDQLISEKIYRLAHIGTSDRHGRFFHTRIAHIIYEAIVPDTEIFRRAQDLAYGFGAMLDEGEMADAFLTWLSSPKTQSLLSSPLKNEILKAMWPAFRDRGPREDVVPKLKLWRDLAHAQGTSVASIDLRRRIHDWLQTTPEDAVTWGLLFQIVWDDADKTQRDRLYIQGEPWLERHLGAASWNWIWQQLWSHRPNKDELINLGLRWLGDNPAHRGWGRVWQFMYDGGVSRTDLLDSALNSLPLQPESPADLPIWQKVESLKPNKTDFLRAIVSKLSRVSSPYKMDQGVEFIERRIPDIWEPESLSVAMNDAIDEPAWAHLWLGLTSEHSADRHLLKLGRRWLAEREDRPEWAHVWGRLVELGFETEELLPIGRDWLAEREDTPEWAHVWGRLVELGFETEELLPIGRDWLAEREDRPEWNYVWQRLVKLGFQTKELLPIGRDWLLEREDRPEWNYVWQRLVKLGFETKELLPIGRDWLQGREDRDEYSYVYRVIYGHSPTRYPDQTANP